MTSLSIICRNIYGHNSVKLDYVKELCRQFNVVCLQEHLLTSENFGLFEQLNQKTVFMHEAKRSSVRGRPSGGTAIITDSSLECQKLESCEFFLAVDFPGPGGFVLITVYLPTNLNTLSSEKRFSEACGRLSRLLIRLGNRRVLVCGDFQCDLTNPSNKLSEIFFSVIPAGYDLCEKTDAYTYIHNSGSTTNIDHVLCNFSLGAPVTVDSEHTVSDHLGLCFKANFFPCRPNKPQIYATKTEWNKINADQYKQTCDEILGKIKVPFQLLMHGSSDLVALDIYCTEIIHAMKTAEQASVPTRRFKPGISKPGWSRSPKVRQAKARAKFWLRLWRDCERPRSGVVFEQFRNTKKTYNKSVSDLKAAEAELASQEAANNPVSMWKSFRQSKPVTNPASNIPEEQWVKHYSEVFGIKHAQLTTESDSELSRAFASLLSQRNYFTVSIGEVLQVIKQLRKGKAPGHDGIVTEHLRCSSPLLIEHLTLLYQMCLDSGAVPKSFALGIVSNVLKKGKNRNLCSSYRPITVSSTLSKVLERLLLPELLRKCKIDNRQFGFRRHLGCAFAHRLLTRIVSKAQNQSRTLLICAVDVSAAFDSVIHSKLILNLLHQGVNPHVAAVLWHWYSSSLIRVKLSSEFLSKPIKLHRGLRQGSVLSPVLFNSLTSSVTKKINGGFNTECMDVSLLCYADDILLVSTSLCNLQANIDLLSRGYTNIGLVINPAKTEFLVFEPPRAPSEVARREATRVTVAGQVVLPSRKLKYLGITYGSDLRSSRALFVDQVLSGFRSGYAKLAALKFKFNKHILARLYRAVALPFAHYISPVWHWLSNSDMLRIRSGFCKYLKFLLGLPLYLRNTGLLEKYHIPDPVEFMPNFEKQALVKHRALLFDFPATFLLDS